MRSLVSFSLLTFALFSTQLHAQAPGQAPAGEPLRVKAKIKRVNIQEQLTPQISAGGVKEKRWRPKNWIETDVEFEIEIPAADGGSKGSYGSLQMNIYLALQQMSKDGKRQVAKVELNLVNVPAREVCHALAYMSPASLKMIFQKDIVTASTDIQGWGVEIMAEGQRIAADSSLGKEPWWETKKDALNILSGVLVHKSKTPFGIFFGDYDVGIQPQ